jgi:hypothetical protein
MIPRSSAADLLVDPRVLVYSNHLVYYCFHDRGAQGWRCGRCEVGVFQPRPGESVPQPGRVCTVCQAEVCLLHAREPAWRRPLVAIIVVIIGTWPFLLWWAFAR